MPVTWLHRNQESLCLKRLEMFWMSRKEMSFRKNHIWNFRMCVKCVSFPKCSRTKTAGISTREKPIFWMGLVKSISFHVFLEIELPLAVYLSGFLRSQTYRFKAARLEYYIPCVSSLKPYCQFFYCHRSITRNKNSTTTFMDKTLASPN